MFYIYAWAHQDNGKTYIGQTRNPDRRKRQHSYELAKGKHANSHLQHAWAKYGEGAFEFFVIASFETKPEVDEAERFYIAWFRDLALCYNHMGGGEGNYEPDDETRRKLGWSKGLKRPGNGDHNRGRVWTEEERSKLRGPRPSLQGRKFKPETLAAMSAAKKGRKLDPEHAKKCSEALKRRVFTEEYRKKLSEAAKGNKNFEGKHHSAETVEKMKNRVFTDEHRRKIAEGQKARWARSKS